MSNQNVFFDHAEVAHKLLKSPEGLINLIVKDKKERKWIMKQLEEEGPHHKQVLSALLLSRLNVLLQILEKEKTTDFELQEGYEIARVEDKMDVMYPVKIPIHLAHCSDEKKVANAIAHAPEHEVLLFAISLQVIEWAIDTIAHK